MAYTWLDPTQNLIRLLHLSPASSEDETIKCRFSIVLLDNKPEYEALSYVWGDMNDTALAEVDGHRMTITTNLHSALKQLRHKDKDRILWVDALCIDQSKDQEKMHQVSRMKYIYSQASQVVVWLGTGWDGSNMAMEFLRILAGDETLHLDPQVDPSISVNGLYLDSSKLCGHIIRFFNLPWWKRTWTVQEFVLAQKLVFQCAQSIVTQKDMYMARENFWRHKDRCCQQDDLDYPHPDFGTSVSTAFIQPASLDIITKQRGPSYSVLAAIANFSNRAVTDPKDRVYGMLGLGTGPYSDLVEPDYSYSPEKICELLAMNSVERTGKLEFLSHLFERDNPKLPSFLPNWTGKFTWTETYASRIFHTNFFSASLDLPAEVALISPSLLSTRGVIFDTISALANLATSAEDPYCNTSDSRLVAFWHSMCGGMELVLRNSNRFAGPLKGKSDLSKYHKFAAFFTTPPQQWSRLWDNDMSHIILDVETAIHGRRFFVTQKGDFGFAAKACREGDLVAVLAGGNVPYVIRRESRIGHLGMVVKSLVRGVGLVQVIRACVKLCFSKCYSILGDSYVHGVMYGEAFEILNGAERKLGEIVLV
ncbi:HET-domain-containing protein [Lophium mytilinum]|uniref:HET-domain-containing protein n=1 Tax=Lophium mytilinum TaxID=390894 RepID=A0A6A6QYL1_9PEZI|nr:HET-domain-containing protein [Lophium mytilinum]